MEAKTSKVVLNNLQTFAFITVTAFSAGMGWAIGSKTGSNILKIRRKKKETKKES